MSSSAPGPGGWLSIKSLSNHSSTVPKEFKNEVVTFIKDNYNECKDKTKEQLDRFIYFIQNNEELVDKINQEKDYDFLKKLDIFRDTNINEVSPWIIKNIFNEL